MFKTNLRIALRNLWKYKGFSTVNILGLSISLAGCILILLYVRYERSYDAWNPRADNVYRLVATYSKIPGELLATSTGETAPALAAHIPAIQTYTRFYYKEMGQHLLSYGDKNVFSDHTQGVDSTFFKVFPFPFVEGDPAHALDGKGSLVISEDLARRLFGKEPALGKIIRWQSKTAMTITGVFRTPSTPTHFQADAFQRMSSDGDGWHNGNFYLYLLVAPGTNRQALERQIDRETARMPINEDTTGGLGAYHPRLVPLRDMYFRSDIQYDFAEHGNVHIPQVLLGVALLLLAIACINFTNFNITQSVRRARETGIRKVMGAHRVSLAFYYLLETTLQVFVSLLAGIVLAELFLPSLNGLLGTKLRLFGGGAGKELTWLGLAGLFVIAFSGGYVAYYISGLEPTKVLKGQLKSGGRGASLRKGLLIVQFSFAALTIGALLIIHAQERYMEHLDPGFNKDQVLVIDMHAQYTHMLAFDSWKPRFLALPGVRDATKANFLPGSKVIQVIAADFNGEPISQLDEVTVGYDYPEVMGMHFVAGRSFNPAYGQDSNGVVVNETAARRYHLYALVGKPWIENWIILGIVKDFNQRGFETATEPTAIRIETRHSNPTDHILLKVDGRRLPQTIAALNAMWTDIEPGFPLEYHFLDEQFNQMFLQYRQMDVVFMAFAGLTLFIALLGIFVLSAFLALQRSKEIGIRKVLGASVQGVIRLLNRDFLILVLLADVIALPVLWFLSQQWLQGFAYRIPLPWFAFAGTVLLTLGCTLATVSFQAWKAATADPVKALKYE